MSDTTGGPAFPVPGLHENNDYDGMTLRDYFAAKAMQGLLSDRDWRQDTTFRETAYAAYQQSDAMLWARGQA